MSESRRCLICCERLDSKSRREAHTRCLRRLFDAPHAPRLDVDASQLHLLGLEMAGQTSLSGVQKKIALGVEHEVLRVSATPTRYILKPGEESFPDLPENEHLCMLLAGRFGFDVPPVGLMPMNNGRLALIVRRFDRTKEGRKLAMEDFCQLSERLPAEKYEGSAEACVKIVRQYSAAPPLDLRELFRLFLFAWWIGNGDLHLKNLSLLTREDGETRLSPIYDQVNTNLVIPNDPLALPLAGKRSNLRVKDWLDFGERCGLPPLVIADVSNKMANQVYDSIDLTLRSFLPAASRATFALQLLDRFHVLGELARTAAETSGKRLMKPVSEQLTGERAGEIRLELESFAAGFGLSTDDAARRETLTDLDWLSKTSGGIFEDGGAFAVDKDRAVRALNGAIGFERILRSFKASQEIAGVHRVGKHLRALLTETEPGSKRFTQAQEHFFQLEIGAMLKAKGWKIEYEYEGTDIVLVDSNSRRIGIECKRPQKESTVVQNVRDGIEQLQLRGIGGIVVVSLDALLPPDLVPLTEKQDKDRELSQRLSEMVQPFEKEVLALLSKTLPSEDSLSGAVLGVLFCASPLIDWSLDSGDHRLAIRFGAHALSNPALSIEDGEVPVQVLRTALLAGERQLWLSR